MSGEDPGYVPPDHMSTTEFRLPGRTPPAEPQGSGTDGTVVDAPRDDDRRDDEVEVTIVDRPAPAGQDDGPPATVTDLAKPTPVPPPPTGPDPEGRTEPHRVPQGGEAPWTEQFGAEQAVPSEQPPPGPAVAGAAAASSTAPTPDHGTPVGPAPAHMVAEAPTAPTSMRAESQQGPHVVLPPTPFATPPAPPASPPQSAPPPPRPPAGKRSRRPAVLIAAVAAVLVLGAGAAATLLLNGGSGKPAAAGKTSPSTAAATSAQPSAGATPSTGASPGTAPTTGASPGAAPGQPGASSAPPGAQPGATAPSAGQPVPTAPSSVPPVGPLKPGNGVSYQLVQQDPGYFEGRFVITNKGSKPMKGWRITFEAPGGNVRNIWGAELVKRGSKVEIRNLPKAAPIEPGGTWEVQYGAAGTAADPKGCRLDKRPCGF
ncbi:cellulose binding domain-containing protein [Actinomadura hibisca]|uniref:cellulose binding domain-containing protein n=1 Tax=Actinomadura hibisca TaxID=68565 RepID=UPI00082D0B11|nr:cellulose binding domain-containing protein [Actinomadura hibisca]